LLCDRLSDHAQSVRRAVHSGSLEIDVGTRGAFDCLRTVGVSIALECCDDASGMRNPCSDRRAGAPKRELSQTQSRGAAAFRIAYREDEGPDIVATVRIELLNAIVDVRPRDHGPDVTFLHGCEQT